MNGTPQFFALLDDAGGQTVSKVNDLLAEAIKLLHYSHPALTFVQQAAALNSELGDKKLKALETWGKADGDVPSAAQPQAPQLRPGMQVVDVGSTDVGDPAGKGTVDPARMSHRNWRFYQQHNLGPKWAQIFSGHIDIVNTLIGALPGNLTATGPEEPIVRDNLGNQVADLRTWT